MLWIHIGMPKTGTTALQAFMHHNARFLSNHDINYMTTGRDRGTGVPRLICHNPMAMSMSRGWAKGPDAEAFEQELKVSPSKNHIISSEMFFGRDLAPLHNRFLSRYDGPVKIVVYLRRFDDFIDADYKQRAKNGMVAGGVDAFVKARLSQIKNDANFLNIGAAFEQIVSQLPSATICPRLYLREELVGADVITDFLSLLGLSPEDVELPNVAANQSLSRIASEALGLFDEKTTGHTKKARRRLSRTLQQSDDPLLFGRGDVLTSDERQYVNETLEQRNAEMRQQYFPNRDRLFPQRDQSAGERERGNSDELLGFQYAVRKLLALIHSQS